MRTTMVSLVLSGMTACNMPLGVVTGPAPGPAPQVLTKSAPALAECPSGGVALEHGVDVNANGVLEAEEVTAVEVVCNEADAGVRVAPYLTQLVRAHDLASRQVPDAAADLDANRNSIRIRESSAPLQGETCSPGEISWDADFAYFCVGYDTWKRAALTAF